MAETITISLNGDTHQLQSGSNVLALLEHLNIDPNTGGIAVAISLRVVPRSAWPSTLLSSNDEVEIIRATAGG